MKPSGTKRPRGRPVTKDWPELIPDTPENIAKALVRARPKKPGEWKYMRDAGPEDAAPNSCRES